MKTNNSQVILVVAPIMPALLERLSASFTVWRLYEQADPHAFLARQGAMVNAVVTRGDIGVTTAVLAQLPHIGLIAVFGVGTDAIDLTWTRQHRIAVTVTSGVLTNDVADMAMGLLLAGARQLCQGDRFVREGRWLTSTPGLATQVSEKRMGILGMGNIGRAIARRASGFDMAISYTDRAPVEGLAYRWCDDVYTLARESDFLVIAASGGPANRGLIDGTVFQAMPKHAWLINVARGSLVDQAALITALQQGDIASAGLDVYEEEPHVPEALRALDNVVLQPHVASATHETRQKMSDSVFANVAAFFNNTPLPGAID